MVKFSHPSAPLQHDSLAHGHGVMLRNDPVQAVARRDAAAVGQAAAANVHPCVALVPAATALPGAADRARFPATR